jgi:nitrogen fixation NifU-like protein
MNLYEQALIDYFRNPKHRGSLSDPDFSAQGQIPSCGDRVIVQGMITNDHITGIAFDGAGCVISQAAASLLTEHALGKSIDTVLALDKNHLLSMLGIQLGPMRMKCAELALSALHDGLREYREKSSSRDHAQSPKAGPKTRDSQ